MDEAKTPKQLPSFAQKLKTARESAGMTQAQLAVAAGLHLGAVFKLEQGVREPAWATVQALAKALGVTCEAFADSEDVKADDDVPPAKKTAKGKTKGK